MIQLLEREFQRQIDILKRESAILEKKLTKARGEIEHLEEELREKEIQSRFFSKSTRNEINSLLITSRGPACPRCLAKTGTALALSTFPGTETHDIFRCKSCGYRLEVEL